MQFNEPTLALTYAYFLLRDSNLAVNQANVSAILQAANIPFDNHLLCYVGLLERTFQQLVSPLSADFWSQLARADEQRRLEERRRKAEEELREKQRKLQEEWEEEKAFMERQRAEMMATIQPQLDNLAAENAKIKHESEEFQSKYAALKQKYETEHFSGVSGLEMRFVGQRKAVLHSRPTKIKALLEIKIGKRPDADQKRAPFELALVLDRSGSMSGSPLQNAKQAIEQVLEKMHPDDVLHLVTYDDTPLVEFSNGHTGEINNLRQRVSRIQSGGSTNIEGGLKFASNVLLGKDPKPVSDQSNRRIFLFSDGEANVGIQSVDGLSSLSRDYYKQHGIITSSFGIGAHYNSEMMQGIASSGHGTYFFIDLAENIPKIVDKGLRGLTSLLAINAKLILKPKNGCKKVFINEKSVTEVPVGDLREMDLKQYLLELELDPQGVATGLTDILDIELQYSPLKTDSTNPMLPPSGVIRSVGQMIYADSVDVAELGVVDEEVTVLATIRECGAIDKMVLQAIKAHRIDDAIQYKSQCVSMLAGVQQYDKYGFAQILLHKAKQILCEYQQQKLQIMQQEINNKLSAAQAAFNAKFASLGTAFRSQFTTAYSGAGSSSAASYAMMAKKEEKHVLEEEDADMGYGLFD